MLLSADITTRIEGAVLNEKSYQKEDRRYAIDTSSYEGILVHRVEHRNC